MVNAIVIAIFVYYQLLTDATSTILECGPMPNLMVALPNIGGALC